MPMMMMEPEPEQRQQLSAAAVDSAVADLVSAAAPPVAIAVADRAVVVRDLSQNILAFRKQAWILTNFNLATPCALLDHTPSVGEHHTTQSHAPLNITGCGGNIAFPPIESDVARAVEKAASSAESAGFSVDYLPPDTAHQSFRQAIARIIGLRWGASEDDGHYEPPTGEVEVHTTIDEVSVVYANGYFINLSEVFGRATPARNQLPYGFYTFGVFYKNCIDFSPLLYRIPMGEPIYLEKP